MASEEQIAILRRMTGEMTDAEPFDDAYLATVIDAASSMDLAALAIWEQKAASSASMVDMTESGSSRRLSQVHDQNLKMVAYYRGRSNVDTQPPDLAGFAYTVGIDRV